MNGILSKFSMLNEKTNVNGSDREVLVYLCYTRDCINTVLCIFDGLERSKRFDAYSNFDTGATIHCCTDYDTRVDL
jgi:hypothetical protein